MMDIDKNIINDGINPIIIANTMNSIIVLIELFSNDNDNIVDWFTDSEEQKTQPIKNEVNKKIIVINVIFLI